MRYLLLLSCLAFLLASPPAIAGEVALLPHVATNADLKALKSTAYTTVVRDGFTTPGDGGAATYTSSNVACSLNAGAGDNGSQVMSSDGKCWLATFAGEGVDVRIFGAYGDGLSHPLSSVYATLVQAQAVYPFATSLTQEIDGLAAQAAVNYASTLPSATVTYQSGTFVQNTTVTVSSPNVWIEGATEDASTIVRSSDYGPTFKFALASGYLHGVGVRWLTLIDSNASMTTANSPYHIVMDGVARGGVDHISFLEGAGLISIAGSNAIYMDHLFASLTQGAAGSRVGISVTISTNTNLSYRGNSAIFLDSANIQGGPDAGVFHLNTGILVTACDGFWLSSSHVQGANLADLQFTKVNASYTLGNIHVTGTMLDITNGNGLRIDGPQAVQRMEFQGAASADLQGAASQHGIYVTGAGGVRQLTLTASVDGFKGDGIKIDATAPTDITITPTQIRNLSGGTGINLLTGRRVSVIGGTIGGDSSFATGIALGAVTDVNISGTSISQVTGTGLTIGASASYIALSGVSSSSNGGWGGTIANGANYVNITGGAYVSNASGAVQNNSVGAYATIQVIGAGYTSNENVTASSLLSTTGVYDNGVRINTVLTGTTGTITPGALAAGACASGTVAITGATTGMVAMASPNTYPGDGSYWDAQVTSAGTVTVKLCAAVAMTPNATTFNVRVLQ